MEEDISHIVDNGIYILKLKVFTRDPFVLGAENAQHGSGTYTTYSIYAKCKWMMHYYKPHADTVYTFEVYASQLQDTPKILAIHCSSILSASDNVLDVEEFMEENVYEIA